ncbi:hypothetical protein BAE44_0004616 [Dichanthelium oligosanthes]|uniref:Uncharacterized protein n=1 Tax=Dichanthelium oligosanthes TaxID=888268 RepID=A0A1E5WAB3_9POAL|nr:hypothetical protein BAE44_0004616 [Dichanthelium oligosanthes]
MPAPLILSAAVRPPAKIGRYKVNSEQVKSIAKFLKNHAGDLKDIIENILSATGGQKKGDKLDTEAADTAGLYIFSLSVGTSVLQNITGILDITSELVWAQ